ncbi:MAG: NnrS family protein [Nitrosomonadales bacterium]|nr:NnrS family protein [Nitrosomonadales bacterium]
MNSAKPSPSFFRQPVWLVGFRPFFILSIVSGALLPVLWLLVISGQFSLNPGVTPQQWHAHEMFFGFGWAVLGGFLLTATKNWVKIRGYHGPVLFVLAVLWLADRLAFLLPAGFPGALLLVLHNAFLLLILALLLWTLIAHRKSDSYPENWLFILSLPLFLLSKNLLLSAEHFEIGWTMALGLFRLAVVIMLERTLSQFMKAVFQVDILRNSRLDSAIRLGALVAVFEAVLPVPVAVAVLAATAALLLFRFFFWSPLKGLSRLDIGVMYAGYLGLVASLVLECLRFAGKLDSVGNVAAHTFTLLCMGLIIPAMLVRISQGHTGRKILFAGSDKFAILVCGLGGLIRIVPPQIWPSSYQACIALSALCWTICYALIGWRLIPFLLGPRVDGKEH